jgi:hypothetical protein
MKSSHPPTVATWLLEHLRSGQESESLTGDLVEEYGHRRSNTWYWRQVIVENVVSLSKVVRSHSLLAIRAMATGWAIWLLYEYIFSPWVVYLFGPFVHKLPLIFGYASPTGIAWWLVWLSVRTGSGWVVAKLHRTHAAEMVLAFSASVLLWKFQGLPFACHLTLEAVNDPRYRPAVLDGLMSIFLPPFCIALGGLLAGRAKQDPSAQNVQIAT